jgi:hypothetical protein
MGSKPEILNNICQRLKAKKLKAAVVKSALTGVQTLVVSVGEGDGFLCYFPKDVQDGVKVVFTLDIEKHNSARRSHFCRYLERIADRLPNALGLPRAEISDKKYAQETSAIEWFQTKLSITRWDSLYIICRRPGTDWNEKAPAAWLEAKVDRFMKAVMNLLFTYELPPRLPNGYSDQVAPYSYVYQLKIVLKETNPVIWRRIQVPATYTFWDLHKAIQDTMGWEDCHFNEFRLWHPVQEGSRLVFGIPIYEYEAGM